MQDFGCHAIESRSQCCGQSFDQRQSNCQFEYVANGQQCSSRSKIVTKGFTQGQRLCNEYKSRGRRFTRF